MIFHTFAFHMIKNILGTTGTRILNAIINLAILIILTNNVGSEGFGLIMIIIIAITIIQLAVDLIAGSSIIYFSSRTDTIKLLVPSYLWIAIVILFSWSIFSFLGSFFPQIYNLLIPVGYESDILSLALINAMMLTNYNLLLGHKRIGIYNVIFTIQILTLISVLIYRLYIVSDNSIESWVISVYFAYSSGFVLSLIAVVIKIRNFNMHGVLGVQKKVFKFGVVTQLANILHIANKRIGFYFLKSFTGLSSVGIYGAGTQLTEGLRLIGQSISLVQFSEISNSNDKRFAIIITIKLMKFSVVLTSLAVLVLLLIPTNVYSLIFSKEFHDLKYVIMALSPGVIGLSINTIFSHYFGGIGRPVVSLWANTIGFIITIILALILIPVFGYIGAAATASASYISSVIYQYFLFQKETGTKFKDWLPDKNDIKDFKNIIRDLKNKK